MTLQTLFLAVFAAALAPASTVSIFHTGNFTQDDNVVSFNFDLAFATTVTLRTWSFAGGTNAAGALIPEGGFAPVLSVFDGGGAQELIALDHDGGSGACGPRAVDSVSGFCWDPYLNLSLTAGSYILLLTEDDNMPNGPTLADGFFRDGQGNFTGPAFGGPPGSSFILADGSQRTSFWAVEMDGVSGPTNVPEASTGLLVALGGLTLIVPYGIGSRLVNRSRY